MQNKGPNNFPLEPGTPHEAPLSIFCIFFRYPTGKKMQKTESGSSIKAKNGQSLHMRCATLLFSSKIREWGGDMSILDTVDGKHWALILCTLGLFDQILREFRRDCAVKTQKHIKFELFVIP